MTKAERKKKFVAECPPYPQVVMSAGQWFEVLDGLELGPEVKVGLLKIAERIRKQCTQYSALRKK